MTSSAPRTGYHHGDLRQTLLEAACRHLREKPADSLSLRALAREVGVSQTAPYRHFESRNALFAAIATWGFELMTVALKAARDAGRPHVAGADVDDNVGGDVDDVESAINRVGLAYVDWALDNPEKYQLFFDSSLLDFSAYEELHRAGSLAFDVLLGLVRRGQHQGLFVTTMPAEKLAATLWSSVHGLASLIQKNRSQDFSARREEAVPKALAAMNADRVDVMGLFIKSIRAD